MSGPDPYFENLDLKPSADEVDQNYGYRERYEPSGQLFERFDQSPLTDDQISALIPAEAHKLVLDFEVAGRAGYDQKYCHPCRPPEDSGITIGIGYDIGYDTANEFIENWKGEISEEDFQALAPAVGLKGDAAQAFLPRVKHLVIPWNAAEKVYHKKTVPKHGRKTVNALHGSEKLQALCFGALFSLIYNRGPKMEGDRRREMRNIRDLITIGRPDHIPHEFRAMKYLWVNSAPGLVKRREAEAVLFEKGLVEADKASRAVPAPIISLGTPDTARDTSLERLDTTRGYSPTADGDGEMFGDADYTALPAPRQYTELERAQPWEQVRWVDDDNHSTEYRHILEADRAALKEATFLFSKSDLELLIRANSFAPRTENDRIIFGLRGALLDHDTANPDERFSQFNRQSLRLKVTRPNHQNFRCVIGVWNLKTDMLSGFIATTVPNRGIVEQYTRLPQKGGNMLPCGCYQYVVGTHHQTHRGCLREGGPVAVLRSSDNLFYDVKDKWDFRKDDWPYDNIHPAFYDNLFHSAEFSSFGCQTIRGTDNGDSSYTQEFAKFRAALGLGRPDNDDGRKYSYVLLTGQEAAIAAKLRADGKDTSPADVRNSLVRLRQGSQGEEVKRLQTAMAQTPTGNFTGETTIKLVAIQRAGDGELAGDGVYSPALDAKLGLHVFGEPTAPPPAPPIVMAAAGSAGSKLESARGGNGGARDPLEAVYYELGRRSSFAQRNPDLLTASSLPHYEAVTTESWFGTVALGKRVFGSLEERAHALICGDGEADKADRDKIQTSLVTASGQGREQIVSTLSGIISGWLMVPSIVARPVAEILVDRVFGGLTGAASGNITTMCQLWYRRIHEPESPASNTAPAAGQGASS
jgi:hypothetical protein